MTYVAVAVAFFVAGDREDHADTTAGTTYALSASADA